MGLRINSTYHGGTIERMETIGGRIRTARKALGLNQIQLSQQVGIDQSTLSDIENGASFGAGVLMSLSAALFKSPQYLMTGKAESFDLSDEEAQMLAAYRAIRKSKPSQAPAPIKSENIETRQINSTLSKKSAGKRRAV